MEAKKIILVSHDIEKVGSFIIKNPIISVGFFIGDDKGNQLHTHRFNISVKWPIFDIETKSICDYGDFEPRCWNEFWKTLDPEIKNKCLIDTNPPAQAWKDISDMLDNLEILYPESDFIIKFLTDNASFDTASIDYALEKYANRAPMRYSSTGKYRSVISADDMFEMLPPNLYSIENSHINSIVKHDHDPVNDAHYIYLQYIAAKHIKI